jgi:hypothetical protein
VFDYYLLGHAPEGSTSAPADASRPGDDESD